MTQARWDASDFDDEQTPPGRPIPTMVSLHFVRSALRRRWLVCALAAVLGLLAATAFLVASPGSHNAKSTLVLAHDPAGSTRRAPWPPMSACSGLGPWLPRRSRASG